MVYLYYCINNEISLGHIYIFKHVNLFCIFQQRVQLPPNCPSAERIPTPDDAELRYWSYIWWA